MAVDEATEEENRECVLLLAATFKKGKTWGFGAVCYPSTQITTFKAKMEPHFNIS